MSASSEDTVRAAGGVVIRDGRVALVHRPKYDDWSLPKGKLDAGESLEDAALREVEEETGLRCSLGEHLGRTVYLDRKGRQKTVDYWQMTVEEDTGFEPHDEVDELRWLSPDEAAAQLTYGFDKDLVSRL